MDSVLVQKEDNARSVPRITVYRQKGAGRLHSAGMDVQDINVLVGRNLKRLRQAAGLTQDALGAEVGVVGNTIAQIEGAIRGMGKELMTRLCNTLSVRPWEFYLDEDTPCIADARERQRLALHREEVRLGVDEDVIRYETYRVEEARKDGAAPARVDLGPKARRFEAAYSRLQKEGKAHLLEEYVARLLAEKKREKQGKQAKHEKPALK